MTAELHPAPTHHDRRRLIALTVLVLLAASTPALLWWWASRSSAAFADSEVLATNHLGAATLDLEVGESTTALEASNLAPGDRVTGQLELINAGTLPLAFVVSGTADGDPLADHLRFDTWTTESICRPDAPGELLASDVTMSSQAAVLAGDVGQPAAGATLAVGEETTLCVRARLLLDAPNDVQGRRTVVDLVVHAVHDVEAPA